VHREVESPASPGKEYNDNIASVIFALRGRLVLSKKLNFNTARANLSPQDMQLQMQSVESLLKLLSGDSVKL